MLSGIPAKYHKIDIFTFQIITNRDNAGTCFHIYNNQFNNNRL
jgi:hypothetical protein